MPRVSQNNLTPEEIANIKGDFYGALSSFKNKEDLEKFLNVLLTNEEEIMLFKRVHLYIMLETGAPYRDILQFLNLSYETLRNHRQRYKQTPEEFKVQIRKFAGIKEAEAQNAQPEQKKQSKSIFSILKSK